MPTEGELYALVTNTSADGTGGIVYKLAPAIRLMITRLPLGNRVEISWPVAGGRLQTQVSPPGVGLGTNWVDVPGSTESNQIVVPIDPLGGSAFYRLVLP